MSHGMRPGQGSWGRFGAGGPSCLPGLSTCPLVFCSLDEASYWERENRSKRSEADQPHTFISSQEQPVRDGLGRMQGAQTFR